MLTSADTPETLVVSLGCSFTVLTNNDTRVTRVLSAGLRFNVLTTADIPERLVVSARWKHPFDHLAFPADIPEALVVSAVRIPLTSLTSISSCGSAPSGTSAGQSGRWEAAVSKSSVTSSWWGKCRGKSCCLSPKELFAGLSRSYHYCCTYHSHVRL